MKVGYDPYLIEDAVFVEVKRREEAGDLGLYKEYQDLADKVYESASLEEREEEFKKLHWTCFCKLGFGEAVGKVLEEFPGIAEVTMLKAVADFEEGADLKEGRGVLWLIPSRFLDIPRLEVYLRHELMHLADMLSDDFGYVKERASPPQQVRYGLQWDIYIDSRLIRMGRETVSDKEGRSREFEELYRRLPKADRGAIFENLWQRERLTHKEIWEKARDGDGLLARNGVLLPGSSCPLCKFPFHAWTSKLKEEDVIAAIRTDFPLWDPREGACDRCVEVYRINKGG